MSTKVNDDSSFIKFLMIVIGIIFVIYYFGGFSGIFNSDKEKSDKYEYSDDVFSIITTPENKVLEDTINDYAKDKGIDIRIEYADNLEIVDILNGGKKFDAVWASNSVWLDMLDSSVRTSNLKSTSITPIVFGIKKSVARDLGLIDQEVSMKDLLKLIEDDKLKFSMANPIMTNSGASAYFNILSTLAGNPEVLTLEHLNNEKLKNDMKTFFTGLERTSGDEDFLEKSFINGDYNAAVTYESSIISINQKLVKEGREPLYLIYPTDGVSISDSPLVYINNDNEEKKEIFLEFQSYILSEDGQKVLANLGRRTWYGGTTDKADRELFNKDWGIDTTKYISSVKYPSKEVIKAALSLYQTELRKPVHVVFCLDYSGSMSGEGISSLIEAMEFIFGEEAVTKLIQFSEKDLIDVILFNYDLTVLETTAGDDTDQLLESIKRERTSGSTALFPAVEEALTLLENESSEYNVSIIVMTDGAGNVGEFWDVKQTYKRIGKEIPIYSITFDMASEYQLNQLAELSNGKVFDGRTDLVSAFKTVRGYN